MQRIKKTILVTITLAKRFLSVSPSFKLTSINNRRNHGRRSAHKIDHYRCHLDNILRNVVCPRLRPRSRRICHYGIDFSLLRRPRHGGRDGRNRLRRNCLIKPGEIWNKSH